MTDRIHATFVTTAERRREAFEDPDRGDASWFTLFSADMTPTESLSAGIAELPPGGVGLTLHRHEQPEIYYITDGSGIVTIDGVETRVTAGTAAFIPGDAEHGIRNAGDTVLRLFYVFPTHRFSDVVYRFTATKGP